MSLSFIKGLDMSAAENSSEMNSDDPSNVQSANQDQINHIASQSIQPSYWIPGNNNMGSMGMPYGYYSYPYMPFSTYHMSPMMPNMFMPFGPSSFYAAPNQIYPPYLHNQQLQPQMLMPPPAAPTIMYNPMLAGHQHHIINYNQNAYATGSTQSMHCTPTSTKDGALENPSLASSSSGVTSSQDSINDPTSRQDSANEASVNEVSQNTPSTETLAVAMAGVLNNVTTDSPSLPLAQEDTSFFETENSSSAETPPRITNTQGFNDNPAPTDTLVSSEACKEQSEQDAVPQPQDGEVSLLVSLPLSETDVSSCQDRGSSSSKTSPIVVDGNSLASLPCTASAPPSTPPPKALDGSSNASPIRASESGTPAAVPQFSTALESNIPADTMNSSQKRRYQGRYAECRCPYCKADDYNRPRFRSGTLKHICHFPNCTRVFHRPGHLKKHLEWHGGRKYFCECQQGFARKVELSTHIESCEKSKPSSCQGSNNNSQGNRKSNERGQYICEIPNCGKIFTYSWVLKRHLRWHNDKKNFICQYCNREYALEGLLDSHMKNVHRIKPAYANSNGRPTVAPASCSVRVASPQNIDIDFNLNSTSSKYYCSFDKCGKVYKSFNRLKEHMTSHLGIAPYVCPWPLCGKEFTRASYLHGHQVTHSGEKK